MNAESKKMRSKIFIPRDSNGTAEEKHEHSREFSLVIYISV